MPGFALSASKPKKNAAKYFRPLRSPTVVLHAEGRSRAVSLIMSIILFLSISLLVFFSDLVTKAYVSERLSLGQSIPVVKNIFHISLVHNTGIAFGLFKNLTAFFIGLSLIVIFYIALDSILHLKYYTLNKGISFGLLLGGACGNLLDRIRLGYVRDFLDFRVWPVFNLADSAITIGVLLLAIEIIGNRTKNTA